jgi:hypothetical protein
MRKLLGAVGIENNTDWNFKDLEEMQWCGQTLKRNDEESRVILIGPSMALHLFQFSEIPSPCVSTTAKASRSASGPNLAARMASQPSQI